MQNESERKSCGGEIFNCNMWGRGGGGGYSSITVMVRYEKCSPFLTHCASVAKWLGAVFINHQKSSCHFFQSEKGHQKGLLPVTNIPE